MGSLASELAGGGDFRSQERMKNYLENFSDQWLDFEPSHELLAVIETTARVRDEVCRTNCGSHFVAFTDGSCSPDDHSCPEGPGGWATIIFGPRGERWEVHDSIAHTTSNRAEVCAMLAALSCVPHGVHLGIQSDSRYLVDHVRAGCRANDNDDLWAEIREMVVAKGILLSASWVAGHNGHRHNERVDHLASNRPPSSRSRRSAPRLALAGAR